MYIHVYKFTNWYIHVYTFHEKYEHVCTMYMICLYYSIVYTWFIHVYTLYIHVYAEVSGFQMCTRHPGNYARAKGGPQKAHFFCFFPGPAALPFALLAAGLAGAASSPPGSNASSSSSSSTPPPPQRRRLRRGLLAWRRRVRGLLALSAMGPTVQDLQDW